MPIYETYPTHTFYLAHRREGTVTLGLLRKFWNFSISLRINWYQWKEIDVGKSRTLSTATVLKLTDLNPTALTLTALAQTALAPTSLTRTALALTSQTPTALTPTHQALTCLDPDLPNPDHLEVNRHDNTSFSSDGKRERVLRD